MSGDFSPDQKRYLEGFVSGLNAARATRGALPGAKSESSGPDAIHLKAQDRVTAGGGKLADQEKFKREQHPFDAYDRLKEQAENNEPPKPADNFRWRYYGLFYVAPAQNSYMCRLRIPNGILKHWQLAGVADLAEAHGGGFAHVTTRANLQIRDIMLKHAKGRGHIGRVIASVNPLVPKPSTAYQWLPMEVPSVIDEKVQRLRGLTANIDNVFFNIKSERHSFYQALLSLGDRRVAPAIEAAEANGGDWRRAVADAGVDADFFVFRDRTSDSVLPWSIIDGGMKETFFRSELDKSLREEWTLPPKRAAENAKLIAIER